MYQAQSESLQADDSNVVQVDTDVQEVESDGTPPCITKRVPQLHHDMRKH